MTTAEDVKAVVKRYADENFPGWANAGILIRVGGFDETETLLVTPRPPGPASAAPPPPPAPLTS